MIRHEFHVKVRLLCWLYRNALEDGISRATCGIYEVAGDTKVATNLSHRLREVSLEAEINHG